MCHREANLESRIYRYPTTEEEARAYNRAFFTPAGRQIPEQTPTIPLGPINLTDAYVRECMKRVSPEDQRIINSITSEFKKGWEAKKQEQEQERARQIKAEIECKLGELRQEMRQRREQFERRILEDMDRGHQEFLALIEASGRRQDEQIQGLEDQTRNIQDQVRNLEDQTRDLQDQTRDLQDQTRNLQEQQRNNFEQLRVLEEHNRRFDVQLRENEERLANMTRNEESMKAIVDNIREESAHVLAVPQAHSELEVIEEVMGATPCIGHSIQADSSVAAVMQSSPVPQVDPDSALERDEATTADISLNISSLNRSQEDGKGGELLETPLKHDEKVCDTFNGNGNPQAPLSVASEIIKAKHVVTETSSDLCRGSQTKSLILPTVSEVKTPSTSTSISEQRTESISDRKWTHLQEPKLTEQIPTSQAIAKTTIVEGSQTQDGSIIFQIADDNPIVYFVQKFHSFLTRILNLIFFWVPIVVYRRDVVPIQL